jgi:hypothetical protein
MDTDRLEEITPVILRREQKAQGVTIPAGTRGVIMKVYDDGAYVVEFFTPRAMLTLERQDIIQIQFAGQGQPC